MKKTLAFISAFLITASFTEGAWTSALETEETAADIVTETEITEPSEEIIPDNSEEAETEKTETEETETEEERLERERDEKVRAFADRLYRLVLGRAPDKNGFENWVSLLKNGERTAAQVSFGFVFSNEYKGKKTSDEEYIDMMYRVMMNRGADSQGRNNWLSRLSNKMSRQYIFYNFINSAEFSKICEEYGIVRGNITLTENRDMNANTTAFVNRLYSLCLGRTPDINGLNNWCGVLNSKKNTAADVVKGFVFSDEFKNKELPNDEFVDIMYGLMLDRNADSAGKNHWVSRLDDGYSRMAILRGFVESDEFSGICERYGIERGSIKIGGWAKDSDGFSVYYHPDSGKLVTGYCKIDGVNYYFDEEGILRTDWSKLTTYVNTSSSVYSYSDMVSDITGLQQQYPSLVNIHSLGVTADRRQIYDFVIGREDAPKQMVIQAGCHAREYMGCMLVMDQAEELLSHYWNGNYAGRSYKDLLDEYQIHIIPMLNPDGITISQQGLNGINSMSLRSRIMEIYRQDYNEGVTSLGLDAYLRGWKANARGVDINRNFNTPDWAYQGEIARPSCGKYAGPSAASEAETLAIQDLVETLPDCKAVISYHSSGSMIYWQYHQTGEFRDKCFSIASTLKNMTGYYLISSVSTGGGCSNWVVDVKNITGFTIEIGSGDSPLPQSQYAGIWNSNKNVVPYLLSALG